MYNVEELIVLSQLIRMPIQSQRYGICNVRFVLLSIYCDDLGLPVSGHLNKEKRMNIYSSFSRKFSYFTHEANFGSSGLCLLFAVKKLC